MTRQTSCRRADRRRGGRGGRFWRGGFIRGNHKISSTEGILLFGCSGSGGWSGFKLGILRVGSDGLFVHDADGANDVEVVRRFDNTGEKLTQGTFRSLEGEFDGERAGDVVWIALQLLAIFLWEFWAAQVLELGRGSLRQGEQQFLGRAELVVEQAGGVLTGERSGVGFEA